MRKIIGLLLLLTVASVFVFSGCGASKQESQTATQETGQNEQKQSTARQENITLKFWKGGLEPTYHDYWLETIKEYESENPNIKIEYAEAPFGQEWDTKLNTAFASGTAPDMISSNIGSLAMRCEKGQYLDITEYVDKLEDKDDFIPKMLELSMYNNKLFGLPVGPVVELFAYRKDMAREAGLDSEDPPETWEEFAVWAEKLTIRNGDMVERSGFVFPIDDFKPIVLFQRQAGGKEVNAEGMPVMTDQPALEALVFATDLFKNKKVTVEITATQLRNQHPFVQGKAAMGLVLCDQIKLMIKDDPSLRDKIGFVSFKKQTQATFFGAHLFHIISETDKKDLAFEFMNFVFTKEQIWNRYKAAGAPVIRKSLFEDYKKDEPLINTAIINGMDFGGGMPKTTWSQLWGFKYLPQAMQEAFFGKKTPEQALNDNYKLLMDELKK